VPQAAFLSYLIYSLVTSITPGPNNILSMSSAAAHGLARSVPLLLGICAGYASVMVLCGLFVSTLGHLMADLARWLVWPGACYILWLAWCLARSGSPNMVTGGKETLGFWNGFVLQFVNGKIILCALSGLSGFVLPYTADPFILVGCTLLFTLTGVMSNWIWAFGGTLLRRVFQKHSRVFNLVLAGLLVLCVVQIIVSSV